MKTRILTTTIALLLTARAFAVTDTWDGGGADSLFITNANWLDNTAPTSDVTSTDLIFGAAPRLNPTLPFDFDARSITFNNTAGAYGFSGARLRVGVNGITNNDTQTMTFTNEVTVAGVLVSSVHANNGALTFTNTFTIGFATLVVDGADDASFANISGSGGLQKSGAGTMTWAPTANISLDLTVDTGTVSTVADGSTDFFNSLASIAINGTSTFNINESLTLSAAQLTRASGADLNLAAGKTLRVQGGGDVVITGLYDHSTASTITVTGPGSTFSNSVSTLTLDAGVTLNVLAGGSVFSGGQVTVGFIGSGTATVDGANSNLSGTALNVAQNGSTGTATFSNESMGVFTGTVAVAATSGTTGTLNLQSGATVSSGGFSIGAVLAPGVLATGVVTITGDDSELTVFSGGATTIGAANSSVATLNLQDNGSFNSGVGAAAVNATGTVAIAGGNYISNGNLTINGGQFTRDANGTFSLAAGRTLTVQAGGDVTFTGSFSHTTASTIAVTGTGSTFSLNGGLTLNGGSALDVLAGGSVSSGFMNIGTSIGNGTVTINGLGSSYTITSAVASTIGAANGNTGTLRTQASGAFQSGSGLTLVNATGTIDISGGSYTANGDLTLDGGQLTRAAVGTFTLNAGRTLTIQGGGDAIFTGNYVNSTASTILVTGAGSTLSTTGLLVLNGSTNLTVAAGADVTSGAAQINLATSNGTATVSVNGVGSTLTGGDLFIAQAGHTGSLTFSNGSAGAFAGISVDASASIETNGMLTIQSGATVTGTSLTVAPNAVANIGTVSITGTGAALTLTGAATATIGAASGSIATVNIGSGGTFTTGTGQTNVNATGDLNVNAGGTMIVGGDMVVLTSLDIGGTMIVHGNMVVSGALNIGDTLIVADSAPFTPAEAQFGTLESSDSAAVGTFAGDFERITAPALGGGAEWDFTNLKTTGSVTVVPEPGVATLLLPALATLGLRRRK